MTDQELSKKVDKLEDNLKSFEMQSTVFSNSQRNCEKQLMELQALFVQTQRQIEQLADIVRDSNNKITFKDTMRKIDTSIKKLKPWWKR